MNTANDNGRPLSYEVVDGKTGQVVRSNMTKDRARAAADRLDNAYGAYRYQARPSR